MDIYRILTLKLFLVLSSVPLICDSQGIVCETACKVGETCAMVKHGDGQTVPGCISMQEALLLAQALEGGPTGPGTGIGSQSSSVSATGSQTSQTSHGTVSRGFSEQSGQQFNPSPFDVNRDPFLGDPFFGHHRGFRHPGFGGPFSWLGPRRFVPWSAFPPRPATVRPFVEHIEPTGQHIGHTGQHVGQTGEHITTGRSGQQHIGQTGLHTEQTGLHTEHTGQHTGHTGQHTGHTGQHTGSRFPQETIPGVIFAGDQTGPHGPSVVESHRQPSPVREHPHQHETAHHHPRQTPPPRRPPQRIKPNTVLATHAQCRPCFYHFDCRPNEFCGMSERCSGILVCRSV